MSLNHQIPKSPNHQIDLVYPLRHRRGRAEPFPTIYYLTDPALIHALSDLERRQHIGRLEQRLADDPPLLAAYHVDHVEYRDTRWAMLTDADRTIVEASPSLSRSFRGGIAGIADFDRVKCLHAQYAHHLARQDQGGTTLGHLLDDLLNPPPP